MKLFVVVESDDGSTPDCLGIFKEESAAKAVIKECVQEVKGDDDDGEVTVEWSEEEGKTICEIDDGRGTTTFVICPVDEFGR